MLRFFAASWQLALSLSTLSARCIGIDLGTILRDAHIYFMGLRPISEAGTLLVGTILTILAKYFLMEDVP